MDPALTADYIPYIVMMVRLDDAREEALRDTMQPTHTENVKGERRSRRLNTDLVESYDRHLRLGGEELLKEARALMLDVE